jgi:hypothetical protein
VTYTATFDVYANSKIPHAFWQTFSLKGRRLYVNSRDRFRQGNLVGLPPPLIYKNVIIPFTLYATLANVKSSYLNLVRYLFIHILLVSRQCRSMRTLCTERPGMTLERSAPLIYMKYAIMPLFSGPLSILKPINYLMWQK